MDPRTAADETHRQAGFTLTELIIASGAFMVIMTASMAMLVQWQRMSGRSEADIKAVNQAASAMQQIMADVRQSTYMFQYATISIRVGNIGLNITADQNKLYNFTIPEVLQATAPDPAPSPYTVNNAFFASRGLSTDLQGIGSTGSLPCLVLISDQPNGISQPRYIFYFVASPHGTVRARTGQTLYAGLNSLGVAGLYRVEATPRNNAVDNLPRSWYAYNSSYATTSANSALYVDVEPGVGASTLTYCATCSAVQATASITWLTDVLLDPGGANANVPYPFTLRNPHPYSNSELVSPYEATVSLLVSRAFGGARAGKSDIFQINALGFARNVPLPQNPVQ